MRQKVLLAGVGGQGVITLSRLLGDAAVRAGLEVRVGQLHGMSQRGGSVQASVLFGPGQSSFIPGGGADVLVALEPLEALRARPKLSPRTRALVSRGRVIPFTLAQRGEPYPDVDGLLAALRAVSPELTVIDGPELLARAAAPRSLNVLMLGALAGLELLPLDAAALLAAVERRSTGGRLEENRRAFALGREGVSG